jgi:hypothetical protein
VEARVTRTIPAVAAAFIALTTLFGSNAEACVSCEYTPEVTGTPSKQLKPVAKERTQVKERSHTAIKKRRPVQRSVVKRTPAEKDVETAKSTESPTKSESESQTSSTATSALIQGQNKKDSSAAPTTPVATPSEVTTDSDIAISSTAAVADPASPHKAIEAQKASVQEPKAEAKVGDANAGGAKAEGPKAAEGTSDTQGGCKKFFPAVELTLVVPCDQ